MEQRVQRHHKKYERVGSMVSLAVIPPVLSVVIGVALASISLVKGRCKKQNILFSLVILWWSLISAAFVFHQIHDGDTQTILGIERVIHSPGYEWN